MKQIPNIEEVELIKFITNIVWEATDGGVKIRPSQFSHFEEPIGALTGFQKYLHHQLQKARESWLREEIVKLEERQRGWLGKDEDGSDRHPNYDELQTIIDRYHSELDQDKK